MYSRVLRGADGAPGAVLDFGVSGNLWHGVLVMYDRPSGSYWTQISGRSIEGKHDGARLAHVDSTFTSWEKWRRRHPDTEVLFKPEDERGRAESNYAGYFADPDKLFDERLGEDLGSEVGPKEVVFGVVVDGEACALPERVLAGTGVRNAVVGGRPIAWLLDAESDTARAVERVVGSRIVLLERAGDAPATESVRDSLTGEILDPRTLPPLRLDRAYWYGWSRSHRGSAVLTR